MYLRKYKLDMTKIAIIMLPRRFLSTNKILYYYYNIMFYLFFKTRQ